ncbi:MAG TPA: beta-ketoacyl synthase N-terminal-like domain-containing protein [Bacteroidia bacterium]
MNTVYIQDLFCISAAGTHSLKNLSFEQKIQFDLEDTFPVFRLHKNAQKLLDTFLAENTDFNRKSRTIQLTATTFKQLFLDKTKKTIINIGSSRGNTDLWEKNHTTLLNEGRVSPFSSPETTAGSIAHSLLPFFGSQGISLDHSITCGSGLQAIANASAWLKSGMAEQAVVGGSEAPISPFTLAQFKAMGIYSKETNELPSRPLASLKSKSYLCLGEASGLAVLSLNPSSYKIDAIGFGTELSPSLSGISEQGIALQNSMREACAKANIEKPDLIIAHAPGTKKGDEAEVNAIKQVFANSPIPITSNKHLCGHTLGASGMLSLIQAIAALEGHQVELPYKNLSEIRATKTPKHVLINATGFGGNAISLIVSKS